MPDRPTRPGILRDLRDVTGAAAISLSIFGLPLGLAALQITPDLAITAQGAAVERQAAFVFDLDALTAVAPQAARTAPEADAPPVEEPIAEEPIAEEPIAEEPAAEPPTEEPAAEPPTEDLAAAEPTADRADRRPPPDLRVRRPPSLAERGALPRSSARAAHAAAAPTERTSASRGRRCEDATGAIVDLGGDAYTVERSLVDMYVQDLELAQGLASVSWHRDADGRIDGFKIRRIKCGNVLDQAGFENGDVVHSVNGKKIRTVFGAISAYRKLKKKDHLRVELTRKDGTARQLRYKVD